MSPEKIMDYLRKNEPPIIGTIRNNKALISPVTFNDETYKLVKPVLKDLEELL